MAAAIRSLSSVLNVLSVMSPAPRRAAAAERAAATRKPSARAARRPSATTGPARPSARVSHRYPIRPPPARGVALALRPANKDDVPDQNQQDDENERREAGCSARPVAMLGRSSLEVLRIAGHELDEIVDAAFDASGKISGAKARQYGILDDEAGDGVGDGSLEPIADLDPHLAFVGRHDEDGAVVEALLANSPIPAEPVAVVGDVIALQGAQRRDNELVAGLGLELLELALDPGAGRGIEDRGLVHHAAGEGGKRRLGARGAAKGQCGAEAEKGKLKRTGTRTH